MMGSTGGSGEYGVDSLGMGLDRLSLAHAHSHIGQIDPQRNTHPVDKGNRRRGITKFFNSSKGFGFVVDADPAALGGQEVFCHFSAISGKGGFRSLAEGEEVEYELVQGPKGFQAANLTGPGGRDVVGDPKARLVKPPPYMPFPPLPMGYMGDPYSHHYPGSPYTQHVVYVPSTVAVPPSSYAYASHPGPAHSVRTGPPGGASAAFSSYQPYAPPGPYATPSGPYTQRSESRAPSSAYAPLSGPGRAGALGGGSQPFNSSAHSSRFAAPPSPPSTSGPTFGFAPFSPPSFNSAPLYNDPAESAPGSAPSFALAHNPNTARVTSASSGGGFSSAAPSALFSSPGAPSSNGSSSHVTAERFSAAGPVGAPRSSAGTPIGVIERRGTPLGNGTLPAPGGSSSPFGAPLLYTSS